MKKTVLILCAAVLLLCSCTPGASGRDYREDINVPLKNGYTLIIREWSYTVGSGAEIYLSQKDGKTVFLGRTTGGDDGYCPFADGNYEIVEKDGCIVISWGFRASDNASDRKTKTFEIPNK